MNNTTKTEELTKIFSDSSIDDVKQMLSKIEDINKPIGYEEIGVPARKTPVHVLDIALLNSKDIEVIKFLIEKNAIYGKPLPFIIGRCQTVGIFTLLIEYPNVKNPILKPLVKIILKLIPIPLYFISAAMKNPNPEILKEVLSNKKVLNLLKTSKRKGIDLKTYFKSISTENTEEKYKIFEDLNI